MKHFLASIFIVFGSASYADSTIAEIEDHYKYVTRNVPTTKLECSEVRVPIYGTTQSGNAAAGALLGMIIGGAIGDVVSDGDGGATAGGAVIGGIIGADQAQQGTRTITGYRIEDTCQEVTYYTEQRERVYDYSTINFKVNGERYTLRFHR
jgi:uncharacterized protein YcfJ